MHTHTTHTGAWFVAHSHADIHTQPHSCMHTHTHTHTHTCMLLYTQHTHSHMHAFYIYTDTHTITTAHTHMHSFIRTHIYAQDFKSSPVQQLRNNWHETHCPVMTDVILICYQTPVPGVDSQQRSHTDRQLGHLQKERVWLCHWWNR